MNILLSLLFTASLVHLRTYNFNSQCLKPKTQAWSKQMSVLTDAHSRTLPKWNICVFRSTAFVFLCETVWIELRWFWEVRRVVVESIYRDINPGTGWKCYCSISSRGRQFVVAATYAIQKRKYRVLPQCLYKHRNQ